jgi:hypothetical protein
MATPTLARCMKLDTAFPRALQTFGRLVGGNWWGAALSEVDDIPRCYSFPQRCLGNLNLMVRTPTSPKPPWIALWWFNLKNVRLLSIKLQRNGRFWTPTLTAIMSAKPCHYWADILVQVFNNSWLRWDHWSSISCNPTPLTFLLYWKSIFAQGQDRYFEVLHAT